MILSVSILSVIIPSGYIIYFKINWNEFNSCLYQSKDVLEQLRHEESYNCKDTKYLSPCRLEQDFKLKYSTHKKMFSPPIKLSSIELNFKVVYR